MTDGQGYYAYLPATFIYQDLQFDFIESINETYYHESKRAKFIVPSESGNVNKYFVGTAVAQAPFFLVGCALSAIVGTPVDGYSWPFQLMVGVAALFYLLIGSLFLSKLLIQLGFKQRVAALTVLFIIFGTNLLYYSIYEPSMSHVYSFCTVSTFLFYARKALLTANSTPILLAAASLGLTALIRPVNGIVLLGVPAVAGGLMQTISGIESLFQKKKALVEAVLLAAAIMAFQPLVYVLQTGKLLVWSYQEEGFNFLSPDIWNVLFSYRKGLFVYCPILFLALFGLVSGLTKRKEGFGALALFLTAVVWLISSWWMWYYGGSYGHRAFIEFYPFFAIGLAYALQKGVGFLKPWLLVLAGLGLVVVQLIQTYQYVHNIIPFDNMSKEKYWNIFLLTDKDYEWYYSGYPGEDSYQASDSVLLKHTMELNLGWGNENQISEELARSGNKSAKLSDTDGYGITLRQTAGDLSIEPDVVRVSTWINPTSKLTDIKLVCSLEDSTGASYYWKSYPLRPQFNGAGNWAWTTALFKTGKPRHPSDKFVIYPMRTDNSIIYIDDFEVSFVKQK